MGRDKKGVGIGEWASGYKVTGLQRLHGKFQSGEIIRRISNLLTSTKHDKHDSRMSCKQGLELPMTGKIGES
jgi:hypothetical protein